MWMQADPVVRVLEALEREQADITAHFADGSIFRSDPKRARQLQERSGEIEAEVSVILERWEALEKKSNG